MRDQDEDSDKGIGEGVGELVFIAFSSIMAIILEMHFHKVTDQ